MTAAALVFLCLATGCSTIVETPARLQHPTTVYLTDEVIHSSILMPEPDGQYVEYAFGDWAYAALDRHDPFHTLRALAFSPQGALGRRYLALNRTARPMSKELKGVTIHPLSLERDRVDALIRSLDDRFNGGRSKAENPENHFVFATVDEHYGFFNNCNSLTKRSLQQMGCTVQSRSPFAMYDVRTSPGN